MDAVNRRCNAPRDRQQIDCFYINYMIWILLKRVGASRIYSIQNLYSSSIMMSPKSVFTERAISFLVSMLSFKPDLNPEFEPLLKLHSGCIERAICLSELSDKTAESAVLDLNEISCTVSSHPAHHCNFCSIARRANCFCDSELETYYTVHL